MNRSKIRRIIRRAKIEALVEMQRDRKEFLRRPGCVYIGPVSPQMVNWSQVEDFASWEPADDGWLSLAELVRAPTVH